MKLRSLFATLALCTGLVSVTSAKTVVEIAIGSPDHTTLVAAVKAAGLVETLSGAGPFTIFAPTNAAFAKLPAGTVESLLLPENKAKLVAILTYHVVPGSLDNKALWDAVNKGNGTASACEPRLTIRP